MLAPAVTTIPELNVEFGVEVATRHSGTAVITPARKAEVRDHLVALLRGTHISIRCPEDVLRKVLWPSGFYKNQHYPDIQSSGGTYFPQDREELERKMWSLPAGHDPAERPSYGYAASTLDLEPDDRVLMDDRYGDVRLMLRPEVASRATCTFGDTLAYAGNYLLAPAPFTTPDYLIYHADYEPLHQVSVDRPAFYGGIAEIQIFGRVSHADFERIVFRRQPTLSTRALLGWRRVPWSVG